MLDLMVPFRRREIYHWKMEGSYSLKSVLPTLVREDRKRPGTSEGGSGSARLLSTGHPRDGDLPKRFECGLRFFSRNTEEGPCGAFRDTPSLLSVSQGGHAHADHQREFGLRSSEAFSDRLDVFRREYESPGGFGLAPVNLPLENCDQFGSISPFDRSGLDIDGLIEYRGG